MRIKVAVLKPTFAEMSNKRIIKVKIILHYGVVEEFILHKILWLHIIMHIY